MARQFLGPKSVRIQDEPFSFAELRKRRLSTQKPRVQKKKKKTTQGRQNRNKLNPKDMAEK